MLPEERDAAYVWDMLEAARRVYDYAGDLEFEAYLVDDIGQRNVLAHEYGSIDQARIWMLVVERIPELISQLEDAMPEPPVPA